MPKSIEEILGHLDDLSSRFELFDSERSLEVRVSEELLRRAVQARGQAERKVLDAVVAARADSVSWQRIGAALGTSAQAAQQRYGAMLAS